MGNGFPGVALLGSVAPHFSRVKVVHHCLKYFSIAWGVGGYHTLGRAHCLKTLRWRWIMANDSSLLEQDRMWVPFSLSVAPDVFLLIYPLPRLILM